MLQACSTSWWEKRQSTDTGSLCSPVQDPRVSVSLPERHHIILKHITDLERFHYEEPRHRSGYPPDISDEDILAFLDLLDAVPPGKGFECAEMGHRDAAGRFILQLPMWTGLKPSRAGNCSHQTCVFAIVAEHFAYSMTSLAQR